MSLTPKLLQQGAAGSARPVYIEDVFSTFLYTGNGGTQTITNGIDLSTKGGLVWIKGRDIATNNILFDTSRGVNNYLVSDGNNAQANPGSSLSAFNTTGFQVTDLSNFINESPYNYASWTFREQAKFFDIVTYTGNGTNPRNISHNLGSVPGCIIVKSTSAVGNWSVYHRGVSPINNNTLSLQSAAAGSDGGQDLWGNGATVVVPTSTVFTVSNSLNTNGTTYVAYLFAHNAGGFGLTGSDNVISCGSYTGTGAAGNAITLGYEPQWLMIKRTDATNVWHMQDIMRGSPVSGTVPSGGSAILYANQSGAEFGSGSNPEAFPTSTGFTLQQNTATVNAAGGTYIYIAIRRGPMKVPTTGSSVFSRAIYTGNGGTQSITSNFPVDLAMTDNRTRTSSGSTDVKDRMRGYIRHLGTNGSGFNYAEQDDTGGFGFVFFDRSTNVGMDTGPRTNDSGVSYVTRLFRRAAGFFDIVCYTGTGSAGLSVSHNLTVPPEMIIVKRRDSTGDWAVLMRNVDRLGSAGSSYRFNYPSSWDTAGPYFSDAGGTFVPATDATSTVFRVSNAPAVNASGGTHVAYLFATCPGVSKVGSYTGNGSTQTINCGFAGGARFIIIKRADSSGDWFTFDTARGIIAGNDPFLKFNTTDAEVTAYDAVDPDSSGFIVNNDATNYPINVASATYIFLAIA